MAEQTEAGDVGHGVDAVEAREHRTRRVQLGLAVDQRFVVALAQAAALERRAVDPGAQGLAENQPVPRTRPVVAPDVRRVDHPDHDEAVDRLDRIDGMPARHRNAGEAADIRSTFENAPDRLERQHVDRHADQRQREERRRTHGIDVGNRSRRGNAPEIVGIIDNGREEIGRRYNGLLLADLVDRGVVAGFVPDQKLRGKDARLDAGQQLLQRGRGNLARATATMG